MTTVSRRTLLRELGRAAFAVAVLGPAVAACGVDESGSGSGAASAGPPGDGGGGRTEASPRAGGSDPAGDEAGVAWHRVDLDFVSAYVLVRAGEAAVVDTGVEGSADAIEGVLAETGLGWDAVAHVVLTHKHPDHVGSLGEVAERAGHADVHAGEADIPAMGSPRPIAAVGDGDSVFGLDIVFTPGHTPGHISVLDPAGGLLVAGDALNGTDDGGVAGANPEFSEDMDAADASVRKLAERRFDTVVFGHGDPIEGGADARVAELAESL